MSRVGEPPFPRPLPRPRRGARLSVGILIILFINVLLCTAWNPAYALKNDSQKPINIRAHQVDANEKTGVAIYRGDVILTQGTLRIEADRLEVTLRDGRTETIRAFGKPVRMQNQTDRGELLRGRANRAVYNANTRRIDLQGSVEIERDNDLFTGAMVRYALDDQTFSAEGEDGKQITVVIQPPKTETQQ